MLVAVVSVLGILCDCGILLTEAIYLGNKFLLPNLLEL